ncbi:MAG: UPF0280 family protein [Deltaproteobacteria bacterium]|nr:MAG: UPF0280 family protein [Deltaproteobacteria bacterium]
MSRVNQHNRFYRNLIRRSDLVSFRVAVKETDLFVQADKNLEGLARDLVLQCRAYIETYAKNNPLFLKTLRPWRVNGPAPLIIRNMARAGQMAGVGPMASVAGAISEYVGKGLLPHTDEIVIENGGDVFVKTKSSFTVGIYAGASPLSLRMGIRIDGENKPISVCTSSGKIGHSLSLGKADAVCVVSRSCPLADAAATATANRVHSKSDIPKAIGFAKAIEGVSGLVVIVDDEIGLWGQLEVVPLTLKKG